MDNLSSIYARLKSLNDNLPNDGSVHQKYVFEYNDLLSEIETINKIDLSKFKIPDSELINNLIGVNFKGSHKYSDYKVCDRNYFKMKIEGLLNLFYIVENKAQIGFNADR